jgi:hypothetical protein
LRLRRHLGKLDPAANTRITKAAPELEHDPASDSLPARGSTAEKATGGNCEERSPMPSAPAHPSRHHPPAADARAEEPRLSAHLRQKSRLRFRFAQSVRSGLVASAKTTTMPSAPRKCDAFVALEACSWSGQQDRAERLMSQRIGRPCGGWLWRNSTRSARFAASDELARPGRELTVAIGDPPGRVRPPAQRDPVVAELNVGMVVRCFGKFAYSVNEGQRLREVIESELALQRSVDLGRALAHTPKYRA